MDPISPASPRTPCNKGIKTLLFLQKDMQLTHLTPEPPEIHVPCTNCGVISFNSQDKLYHPTFEGGRPCQN